MDYEHRVRVSVRRGPDRFEALKEIAGVCEMCVSHFCDILARVAVSEGPRRAWEWDRPRPMINRSRRIVGYC